MNEGKMERSDEKNTLTWIDEKALSCLHQQIHIPSRTVDGTQLAVQFRSRRDGKTDGTE